VIREPGPAVGGFACERREAVQPVAAFVHGPEVREACGACPHVGRNLACPPHSPSFREAVGGAVSARVILVRAPLASLAALPPGEGAREGFRRARRLLVAELLAERARGRTVLGSGPCLACDPCAARAGSLSCARPEERLYSLESTGVDVLELVRACFGLELEWAREGRQPDFVSAVGAVFED